MWSIDNFFFYFNFFFVTAGIVVIESFALLVGSIAVVNGSINKFNTLYTHGYEICVHTEVQITYFVFSSRFDEQSNNIVLTQGIIALDIFKVNHALYTCDIHTKKKKLLGRS